MRHPKVTVIMTTYNSEKYLHEAIDSIINQTFSDFEFIIIDDESTDSTLDIIKSYLDPRIKLIVNPDRRGVAYARKIALEMARGEYIAVLDSDDIAYSNRLQLQVDYLIQHPYVHLLGSAYEIIDKDGVLLHTYNPPTDSLDIRWALLFKNVIGHSTVMFKRNVALKLGGYDPQFLVAEDFDLWVRFAVYGKVAQLDQPLVQWRSTPQGIQNKDPANIKKYSVLAVMKSIKLQTGQEITFSAAQCLAYPSRVYSSDMIVLEVCKILSACYSYFIFNIASTDYERKKLSEDAAMRLCNLTYSCGLNHKGPRIISHAIKLDPFVLGKFLLISARYKISKHFI